MDVHRTLPEEVQTRICYTGTKLGTKFNNIKDPVTKCHQHNVVYNNTCPESGCVEDDTGGTDRRLNERVIDHNGRGKNSHLFKHSEESNHPCVALSDFKIIGTTMVIILSEFLMFYQMFLSPQLKRSLIISNKLVYTSCLTSC